MTAQREWFEKDYYAALGVARNASQKDVTKAYRRLARQYHPDANPNNAAAEERFKEISAAYDVLGDEARRREYDEVRRLGPSAFGGAGGGASWSRCLRIHLPRSTGLLLFPSLPMARMAAMPSNPPRGESADSFTFWKSSPLMPSMP